ncbi:hypothetical protein CPSG_03220 [Coccidioides posadasii str. Silveira]|uniref:Uncharacterized protein n=1 Tax=Coccidioides posadasii (strain RMSCC 757 / Silveira) TaxID=443226 RepID=E9D141_COCPS|nr:hypothetical protein CPSG_03220 [Coccidioides posadasii str. Silveira]
MRKDFLWKYVDQAGELWIVKRSAYPMTDPAHCRQGFIPADLNLDRHTSVSPHFRPDLFPTGSDFLDKRMGYVLRSQSENKCYPSYISIPSDNPIATRPDQIGSVLPAQEGASSGIFKSSSTSSVVPWSSHSYRDNKDKHPAFSTPNAVPTALS